MPDAFEAPDFVESADLEVAVFEVILGVGVGFGLWSSSLLMRWGCWFSARWVSTHGKKNITGMFLICSICNILCGWLYISGSTMIRIISCQVYGLQHFRLDLTSFANSIALLANQRMVLKFLAYLNRHIFGVDCIALALPTMHGERAH